MASSRLSSVIPQWAGEPGPETLNAQFNVVKDGVTLDPVRLGSANLSFGRKSDVLLEHSSISRRHAIILHRNSDGTLHLMDLGSAKGTTVNEVKIDPNVPTELRDGDLVRFGRSTREYTVDMRQASVQTTLTMAPPPPRKVGEEGQRIKAAPETQSKEAAVDQLPVSFGKKPRSPHAEKASDATANRRKREAEIAQMTASMMTSDASEAFASSVAARHIAARHIVPSDDDDDDDNSLGLASSRGKRSRDVPSSSSMLSSSPVVAAEPVTFEDRARALKVPLSHEIEMTSHKKPVLTVAFNPGGSRLASGGHDNMVKIWDFGGMDNRHRPFKELEPTSGCPVYSLSFSASGDHFLAATSSAQPAIFDREGNELMRFIRGDMYLTDAAHTKGHTHSVTGGKCHPAERDVVLTSASDGTLRTWNLEGETGLEGRLKCDQIYKIKNQRGVKCHATSCAFDPDGDCIVGGAQDGSVHLWNDRNAKGTNSRPDLVIRSAHPGTDITSVEFSPSGRQLACRGYDDRVTLWDIRRNKEPLMTFGDLESFFSTANATFSPDGRFLCAGTSVRKGQGTGMLKFFDISGAADDGSSLSSSASSPQPPTLEIGVAPGNSVVQVLWHARIQQVICSTSSGTLRLLYDPQLSKNGALLTAGRTSRAANASDFMSVDSTHVDPNSILNPHALPMYRDERLKRRRRDEKRPGEVRMPDFPANGPARGLEKVSAARKTFTETYLKNRIAHSNLKDQDSREELIKYQAQIENGKSVYEGGVYAHNKGVPKLAEKSLEQEKEEAEQEERKALALALR